MITPYYSDDRCTIYHGDCRELLPEIGNVDLVLTDPPYGITSLEWDRVVSGWTSYLKLNTGGSVWVFGSLKYLVKVDQEMTGWTMAQDIIWEKHNGSGLHADRFKRVHEIAVQYYRGKWADVYKKPVFTNDAQKKSVRRKQNPQHFGDVGESTYVSRDGGPRLQRSVIPVRSCHGHAQHPTQKPLGILTPLIEYSCPAGGLVLDPFMGSGSTLRAAKDAGRRAIGIEREEKYCEIAVQRLAQECLALD